MSTYKCPECGNPINLNERHCTNCDYDVTDSEYKVLVPAQLATPVVERPKAPQTIAPQKPISTPGIDSIMAHGSVDASSHNTHNEDKSTHNIDNSQTVNNTNQTVTNTFIIMGGAPAAIPQNIDPQTAEALKQAQQAQAQQVIQQPIQPTAVAPTQPTTTEEGQKGLGSIDGRRPAHDKSSKKWWIAVVAVAVVAIVTVVMIPNKEEQNTSTQSTTTVAPKGSSTSNTKKTTATKSTTKKATVETVVATSTTNAQATAKPVVTKTVTSKPVDKNYESGMKAFKAGDGLAAIQAFKASGSKESLRMIGKIYEEGCGSVEANAMMARKYYKEAENK